MSNLQKKIKLKFTQNRFLQVILLPLKLLYDIYRFHLISEKRYLENEFYIRHGYRTDLRNPKTLNEKLQWLKLNDRTDLHTICADKLAVRDYVSETIGENYLIPLLFSTSNPIQITEKNLPKIPSIIKANHNSGGTIIVKDRTAIDYNSIQKQCTAWLKENYYKRSKEWQYKNISPSLIVEKLLVNDDGSLPDDYKLHCLNGKVEFIQVDIDRFTDHKRNFYDRNWKLLPFTWSLGEKSKPIWVNGRTVAKPEMLDLLIEKAEKLASKFAYARIDFYIFNNQLMFGEITFHHGSGYEIFFPSKWDSSFGQLLKLPNHE